MTASTKAHLQRGIGQLGLVALLLLPVAPDRSVAQSTFDHFTTGYRLEGAHPLCRMRLMSYRRHVYRHRPSCSGCHSQASRSNATSQPQTHMTTTDRCEGCHRPNAGSALPGVTISKQKVPAAVATTGARPTASQSHTSPAGNNCDDCTHRGVAVDRDDAGDQATRPAHERRSVVDSGQPGQPDVITGSPHRQYSPVTHCIGYDDEIELGCAMRYLHHAPANSGTELRVRMSLGMDCVNALRSTPMATHRTKGGRMAHLRSVEFDKIATGQAIITLHFEQPVWFKVTQTSNEYLLTITIDSSASRAEATTQSAAPTPLFLPRRRRFAGHATADRHEPCRASCRRSGICMCCASRSWPEG